MGWGGNFHQSEYIILALFLSMYARARRCLGGIRVGARCCVKPCLVSGEGSRLKHYGVETHVSRNWYPYLLRNHLLLQEGGIDFYKFIFIKGVIIAWYCDYFRMYPRGRNLGCGLFPDNGLPPKTVK